MPGTLPIPQADALPKVRLVVEQLPTGVTLAAAGRAAELTGRHVGYHVAAAIALGLARRTAAGVAVTALGRTLVATGRGSQEETATWRRAIAESPVLAAVAPSLLAPNPPDREALAARIAAAGALAISTASRRAETLLRWRKYVLAREEQPDLPRLSHATDAPVRYSGATMLRSVTIQSFKAFGQPKRGPAAKKTAPIALDRLTVLAGPNGAGKSPQSRAPCASEDATVALTAGQG